MREMILLFLIVVAFILCIVTLQYCIYPATLIPMPYLSISDLSAKYAISERSIYLKLQSNTNIRRKKEGKKRLINDADFAKVTGVIMQDLQVWNADNNQDSSNEKDSESLQHLHNDFILAKSKIDQLENYTNNLQSIANDRALALSDMKAEKNLWVKKFDALQTKHNQTIEQFFKNITSSFDYVLHWPYYCFFKTFHTLLHLPKNSNKKTACKAACFRCRKPKEGHEIS